MLHKNESLRLGNYNYSRPGFYFVTIKLKSIEYLFCQIENEEIKYTQSGEIAREELHKTVRLRKNIKIATWVIMPDHVHLLLEILNNKKIENNNSSFENTNYTDGGKDNCENDNYENDICENDNCGDDNCENDNCENDSGDVARYVPTNAPIDEHTNVPTNAPTSTASIIPTGGVDNTNPTILTTAMINSSKKENTRYYPETERSSISTLMPLTDDNRQYMSSISPKAGSLSSIIRSYKSAVTKHCHEAGLIDFKWQSRYYDSIIQNKYSLIEVKKYILNNPKKWEEKNSLMIEERKSFDTRNHKLY